MATDPAVVFDTVSREFARALRRPLAGAARLREHLRDVGAHRDGRPRLGLRTLSDAARVSGQLRAGFTADFIGLPDGLPALRRVYGLAPTPA